MEKYKNKSLSIDERVEDLIGRMTLKEKVGQLNQKIFGWNAYEKTKSGFNLSKEFKEYVAAGEGIGALYGLFRADPWSGVSFESGITAKDSATVANMVQRYVIENTRMGIPVLISEECSHGHQALEGTVFPVNIGAASTWNPELYEETFSHIAKEIRSRGAHMGLVSILDLMRDPRWGRSEECLGEDPYLASRMAASAVIGLQGKSLDTLKCSDKIVAVMKHFCAQGACIGGHNIGPAAIGERELSEIFLPMAKAAAEAGTMACMAAYNEIDGIPCHANRKLLTEVLRHRWGFLGLVMADGMAVDRMSMQTGDVESAAVLALTAGVDLSLWDDGFMTLESSVRKGKLDEKLIDNAVCRILRTKFLLGLFENPYVEETDQVGRAGFKDSRRVSLQVARESIVLLKNENNILPLNRHLKSIAVIGPNADDIYNQLGDYTSPQREKSVVTVLHGIKTAVSKNTEVIYARGCGIRDTSTEGLSEAINAAKSADVAVLVVGGSSKRNFNTNFDNNGAALVSNNPSEMDCGEGADLAELELGGIQAELVRAIADTGTPVVCILIQGRPHSITEITEYCNAILCGWYPGSEGGKAIAEILFGDVNPSAKLSVSIPRSSSQLPVYYNHKDIGSRMPYLDMSGEPLYPFGYGLSYTSFEYSNFKIHNSDITVDKLNKKETIQISVNIKNTGVVAGAEVAQLYIKDMEASITSRIKELKDFKKVWLEPGDSKTVNFVLDKEKLSVWNSNMEFVVEPGNVKIMVGSDSTAQLETTINIKHQ